MEDIRRAARARVLCITLLATSIASVLATTVYAGDEGKIEGAWQNTVSPYDCTTGTPFPVTIPAIVLFNGGGTFLSQGAPNNPARQPVALGAWEKVDGNTFTTISVGFRYDANGVWNGTNIGRGTWTVDPQGTQLTGTTSFELLDPQGNLTARTCAHVAGTRLSAP
jgi:hypothetical protein